MFVSARVQEAIKKEAQEKGLTVHEVSQRAEEILKTMAGDLRMPILRVEAFFWRKIYRNYFNQILVDETGLQAVADVAMRNPIVIVPTHRSYVDFLLVSYLFFHAEIPLPHIAAGEDFLNMSFVNWMFRHSGMLSLSCDHIEVCVFPYSNNCTNTLRFSPFWKQMIVTLP